MTSLPVPTSEAQYGYVVGRVIRAIADSVDADDKPDIQAATGSVTFPRPGGAAPATTARSSYGNADPSIGFLQVWRPSPAGFGTVQIGSDYSQQGTLFTQYDIRSFGHLTFSGSKDGRKDTVISQSAGDGSLTLQGGYRGSPNKGSFIQLRGADKTPNPAGTVVSFGCDWRTEEQLAASFLAFNFISDTRNVDLAKLHPTGQLEVTTGDLRITTPKTPATATATGAAGEVCWDADYLYVCTATDTWKRAALSTWP